MGLIKVLDDITINKIAAGEVIEKPASIVKELVENSIDAGADSITIEAAGGGLSLLRIIDNGRGIAEEDMETAFLRHATSKIEDEVDLNTITTLGFRGEALASIAAVSKVEMLSRIKDSVIGNKLSIAGGTILEKEQCGCPEGTVITVRDIFYNTPARLKFLKSESREAMNITSIVENLAMSHTNISFKYRLNDKNILATKGDGDLKSVLLAVYGKEVIKNIIPVNAAKDFVSVKGFIGNSSISKNSRNNQSIFINYRFVKNKTITAAVEAAYKSMLTINKFPFFVLEVSVNPEFIDVNVHPTKAEIKFQDEQIVFKAVYHSVKEALISIADFAEDSNKEFKENNTHAFITNIPKVNYTQEKMDFPEKDYGLNLNSELNYKGNSITAERVNEKHNLDDGMALKSQLQNTKADYSYNKYTPPSQSASEDVKNRVPKFEPLAVVGQIHFMYIIAEGMADMYMIDQHAAHERIYYEKYLDEYNKSKVQSQSSIAPLIVDLSLSEKQGLLQNIDVFNRLGYEIEDFGGNSIAIRGIPVIYGNPNPRELFNEILSEIDLNKKDIMNSIDKVFYTMACKSAVKAGDKLSYKEMTELIEQLRLCDNPFNCPHGRPTIIKMSYYELEKKFKRIQ